MIVIGAGVAGATFAAAAAREGARVLLIDEHEEPVTVQRSATQRYLHPSLFDWPNDGWNVPTADTPVLNWTAHVGSDVRNQLVAGFVMALDGLDDEQLIWLAQCSALRVDESSVQGAAVDVATIDGLKDHAAIDNVPTCRIWADLVVVATGFLPERRVPGAISGSYWKDDRLAEVGKNVLIVGDGDGGLTELFRLALDGGQNGPLWHQSHLAEIAEKASPELKAKLRDIDGEVRNDVRAGSLQQLSSNRDPVLASLDGELWLRQDRTVTLIGGSPLLRSNSFLINRFVAARIEAQVGQARLQTKPGSTVLSGGWGGVTS